MFLNFSIEHEQRNWQRSYSLFSLPAFNYQHLVNETYLTPYSKPFSQTSFTLNLPTILHHKFFFFFLLLLYFLSFPFSINSTCRWINANNSMRLSRKLSLLKLRKKSNQRAIFQCNWKIFWWRCSYIIVWFKYDRMQENIHNTDIQQLNCVKWIIRREHLLKCFSYFTLSLD